MCMCGKPNVNGTPGAYSWDGKVWSTRQPSPPDLAEGETLVYDEPGRCGGIDAHSHHFRLVKDRSSGFTILVLHGGGIDRVSLRRASTVLKSMESMDSDARYWLLHTLYSVHSDATQNATNRSNWDWQHAAAEGRIKTRKRRGANLVRVWIEPKAPAAAKAA